jgi:hypothetical protein
MQNQISIRVRVNAERPDFRVFASYFFGDDLHDYDSDGNSIPVTSKQWTELYMQSRQQPDLSFNIWPVTKVPLILEVSSFIAANANRIAYFLARETNGEIVDDRNQPIPLESLLESLGEFDLEGRLLLADKGIWRQATETNPYPNLSSR